jgi:hypothetical protein
VKRLTRLHVPAQWEPALLAVVVPVVDRRRHWVTAAIAAFAVVSAAIAAVVFFHP